MSPDWSAWIGRTRSAEDVLTPAMAAGLAAVLDSPPSARNTAPQGSHWLLSQPRVPQHELGPDGHPARGDFLPPIELPRRMWVGSDIAFLNPLAQGDAVRLQSRIAAVTPKTGSTGKLVFVEVEHQLSAGATECVRERQTLVYREAGSAAGRAEPPAMAATFERRCTPDPVMLFRYSALTFNGHRIHYDFPYATTVENYPGLVVHGPLTATLMLDLCAREFGPDCLESFNFRAVSPAFAGAELVVSGTATGKEVTLAAVSAGRLAMRATARLR